MSLRIKNTLSGKEEVFKPVKSGQVSILYANSKYDKSDDILTYLGYKK
jgi:hypothetical protein